MKKPRASNGRPQVAGVEMRPSIAFVSEMYNYREYHSCKADKYAYNNTHSHIEWRLRKMIYPSLIEKRELLWTTIALRNTNVDTRANKRF